MRKFIFFFIFNNFLINALLIVILFFLIYQFLFNHPSIMIVNFKLFLIETYNSIKKFIIKNVFETEFFNKKLKSRSTLRINR